MCSGVQDWNWSKKGIGTGTKPNQIQNSQRGRTKPRPQKNRNTNTPQIFQSLSTDKVKRRFSLLLSTQSSRHHRHHIAAQEDKSPVILIQNKLLIVLERKSSNSFFLACRIYRLLVEFDLTTAMPNFLKSALCASSTGRRLAFEGTRDHSSCSKLLCIHATAALPSGKLSAEVLLVFRPSNKTPKSEKNQELEKAMLAASAVAHTVRKHTLAYSLRILSSLAQAELIDSRLANTEKQSALPVWFHKWWDHIAAAAWYSRI